MEIRCTQCQQLITLSHIVCPCCQYAQGLDALGGIDPNIDFKSQKLAIWFSLLLGGLGIHKFYLEQHLYGIFYLLFCWTLIPTIIGWVDAFRTFKMTPFAFNNLYCRKTAFYKG